MISTSMRASCRCRFALLIAKEDFRSRPLRVWTLRWVSEWVSARRRHGTGAFFLPVPWPRARPATVRQRRYHLKSRYRESTWAILFSDPSKLSSLRLLACKHREVNMWTSSCFHKCWGRRCVGRLVEHSVRKFPTLALRGFQQMERSSGPMVSSWPREVPGLRLVPLAPSIGRS